MVSEMPDPRSVTSTSPFGSRPTVRTRILIISDTHTQTPKPPSVSDYAYREPLPEADLLLHAGDLTKRGGIEEYRTMIETIKKHPAELKLVIAGNHDITLDEEYCRSHQSQFRIGKQDLKTARDVWCGEDAKRHGVVYLEEGTRTFQLKNGARFSVYSSPYQPEYCDWAFAYMRNEDRFNPPPVVSKYSPAQPVPNHPDVDIMITHGPPRDILDSTWTGEHVGCEHLLKAAQRARPLLHCFGHIHESWGATRMDWDSSQISPVEVDTTQAKADRHAYIDLSLEDSQDLSNNSTVEKKPLRWGHETIFINASIMDLRYRPTNAPWIIDLDLPIGG